MTTQPAVSPELTDAPVDASGPIYRLRGVGRTYGTGAKTVNALRDVNLEIRPGEFVAIQGPSGGGKSTLLQLLGALDRPSAGTIELEGTDLTVAPDTELTRIRAAKIGFVFQAFNLIPTLTATQNVDTALEGRGMSRDERDAKVTQALERVGLNERGHHRPGELSGGQQQRVSIARAIVAGPHVLLADEPTGNLDEAMRDDILTLLEALHADGLTIIAVTHDSAAAKRAQRRLRLNQGTIVGDRP